MLADCVHTIQGLPNVLHDVVLAYETIREDRLYRETHRTFEAFCKETFGVTAWRIRQIIRAHGVTQTLAWHSRPDSKVERSVTLLPENEWQIRPLLGVAKAAQPAAWQKAVERSGGRQPTESVVRAVVHEMNPKVHPSDASASIVRRAIGLLKTVSKPTKNITAAIDLLTREVDGGGAKSSAQKAP